MENEFNETQKPPYNPPQQKPLPLTLPPSLTISNITTTIANSSFPAQRLQLSSSLAYINDTDSNVDAEKIQNNENKGKDKMLDRDNHRPEIEIQGNENNRNEIENFETSNENTNILENIINLNTYENDNENDNLTIENINHESYVENNEENNNLSMQMKEIEGDQELVDVENISNTETTLAELLEAENKFQALADAATEIAEGFGKFARAMEKIHNIDSFNYNSLPQLLRLNDIETNSTSVSSSLGEKKFRDRKRQRRNSTNKYSPPFSQVRMAKEIIEISKKDIGIKLEKLINSYLTCKVIPSRPQLLEAIELWVEREKRRVKRSRKMMRNKR
ncbi:2921_t:CDS:2 [Ambispora leptoticha]|uniref:2921_t:CDS:1 n=1 Tax=Ambispora leptoticha TaxID=144679 RepID=A0A9N9FKS1_9GLOM|nr:2921_t:CDS:2 [Ambispora leptoticha]